MSQEATVSREPSVVFDEFTVEREFPASAARVFWALSDETAKSAWFVNPNGESTERSLDFRVGGTEINAGRAGGYEYRFVATYHDIVPDARIVYSYEMYAGGAKLSVSLTTIQLREEGGLTRVSHTEQGAFFDRHEDPGLRRAGTDDLYEAIGRFLAS